VRREHACAAQRSTAAIDELRSPGQLERQNREHRAWLDAAAQLRDVDVDDDLREMKRVLNTLWPRRSLVRGARGEVEAGRAGAGEGSEVDDFAGVDGTRWSWKFLSPPTDRRRAFADDPDAELRTPTRPSRDG
jgi:hypothetical protein